MELFDPERVAAAANADPEFQLASRFWTTSIRIDIGETPLLLKVTDGRVERFSELNESEARESPWTYRISAPAVDWTQFLEPVPKPFYQDLMAGVYRHGFVLEGDESEFYPHYSAADRLFAIARSVAATS